MSPEDEVRVRHILDAAREAISFAQGQTYDSLESDHMRSLAIIRLLEIAGEAATTVSPELKTAYLRFHGVSQIPWRISDSMAYHGNHP